MVGFAYSTHAIFDYHWGFTTGRAVLRICFGYHINNQLFDALRLCLRELVTDYTVWLVWLNGGLCISYLWLSQGLTAVLRICFWYNINNQFLNALKLYHRDLVTGSAIWLVWLNDGICIRYLWQSQGLLFQTFGSTTGVSVLRICFGHHINIRFFNA